MTDRFGDLLRNARENAGLSITELGQRASLDPSHIYRLEVGERRPSQDSTLVLAEILRLDQTTINRWLMAAGLAPLPELTVETSNFRVRGGAQSRRSDETEEAPPTTLVNWAHWLEEIGLDGISLKQLQHAMDQVSPHERVQSVAAVRAILARVARSGEIPVHTAVIPATAVLYQMLAAPLLQQMFLHAVREAADAGISNILAILPTGGAETLFGPMQEIFDLAAIRVHSIEAVSGMSLGEALLCAEEPLEGAPFAVLIPGGGLYPVQETVSLIGRLLDIFMKRHTVATAAVRSLSKRATASEQNDCLSGISVSAGLVQIGKYNEPDDVEPTRTVRLYRGAGRYILQPAIFERLRSLRGEEGHPVLLRDALVRLGPTGHPVMGIVVASQPAKDAVLQTILQDYD